MKKIHSNKPNQYFFVYLAVAMFYFWLAVQIPYTHDDWRWGTKAGIEQFLTASVNSRYVGNSFVLLMTHSPILCALIFSSVSFLLPYGISVLLARHTTFKNPKHKLFFFLASNVYLLSIERTTWSETYGWIAGFANYVISALFMLVWVNEILNIFDQRDIEQISTLKLITFFIVTLAGQLFLENLAIIHVVTAFILCLVYFMQTRHIPARVYAISLGSLIGFILCLFNGLYKTLFTTGTAYGGVRKIAILGDGSLFEILYDTMLTILNLATGKFAQNIFIVLSLLALISYFIYHRKHRSNLIWCNYFLIFYFTCSFIYFSFVAIQAPWKRLLDFAVVLAFVILLTYEIYAFIGMARTSCYRIMTLWLFSVTYLLPLIIAGTTSHRLLFHSNIILIIVILLLACEIMQHIIPAKLSRIHRLTMLSLIALIIHLVIVYAQIGVCKNERDKIIEMNLASNSTEITLPDYPFKSYLHCPNPTEPFFERDFKAFYGIPDDVVLIFPES